MLTDEVIAAMEEPLTGDWRAEFGPFIVHLRTLEPDTIAEFFQGKWFHLSYAVSLGGDGFSEVVAGGALHKGLGL